MLKQTAFKCLLVAALSVGAGTAVAEDRWLETVFQKKDAPDRPATRPEVPPSKAKPTLPGSEKTADVEKITPPRPDLKPSSGKWRWQILKAGWSEADESGFEAFIRQIGESDCATVHECLTSPLANPRFSGRHPPGMTFFADCADLPFILRGYYAWQNGLPFSFSIRLGGHPRTPGHTSRLYGYQVVDRYDIVGPGPDPRLALPAIYQFVSSEHFRTPPAYAGTLLPDHYPVRISRQSIKPGTVIFDPDGHIAVVYNVTEDGRVFYIDAHPDNSLTRGIFNREFARAEPPMGAGFKRWRPQTLVGATRASDGTLVGGRIVLKPDHELDDWSDEQFFGNLTPRPSNWKASTFANDGQDVDYHEFVRLRLAYPGFKYEPIGEARTMLRQLCRDYKYRVAAVNLAIKAGLDRQPQPDRLPGNIYATKGDWEIYSTPSRDARIRTAFEEMRDEIARFLRLETERSKILDYAGTDLRRDLLALYEAETSACAITYVTTDGRPIVLGFEEVKRRLYNLSFDPYHCVERRWGADDPEELKSCPDGAVKQAWYFAEARLRNQLVRTYGEKMGWNLQEIQNQGLDIGIKESPDIDPLKVLKQTKAELRVPD